MKIGLSHNITVLQILEKYFHDKDGTRHGKVPNRVTHRPKDSKECVIKIKSYFSANHNFQVTIAIIFVGCNSTTVKLPQARK